MVSDWIDGEAAAGRAGKLAEAVAGIRVAVFVAAATVGAAVAGSGVALAVTAGTVKAGGKVAMVGMTGESVLQASVASRTTNPPAITFN